MIRRSSQQQILNAAVEILARDGFDRARMSDIGELAGVATGTLYNCFESKEQLHAAVVAECPSVMPPEAVPGEEAPLRERLLALAQHALTEIVDRYPELVRVVTLDAHRIPGQGRQIRSKFVEPLSRAIADILEEQVGLG